MIEPAAIYRISANDAIRQGVNLSNFVGGTQRNVNSLGNSVISGRASFAVESQDLYYFVLVNVDHTDCFTQRIDYVHFSKWLCVGHSIWLRLCRQALYDRHLPKIYNADLFFTPVGGVHLVQSGDVLKSGDPW